MKTIEASEIRINVGSVAAPVIITGDLKVPEEAKGAVLFAHGSGSSRYSPRNRRVAEVLNEAGFATLLIDLLTKKEEAEDEWSGHLRFDIEFLAQRLIHTTDWLKVHDSTKHLPIGYFGASTGAGAALVAASGRENVKAVVSRGGRPDLAGNALSRVNVPTLLIIGGQDDIVIALNESALKQLKTKTKKLEIIPGATHLFEEPGTLDAVADLAAGWFEKYLK